MFVQNISPRVIGRRHNSPGISVTRARMMIRDSFPSVSMSFMLTSEEEADELGWEGR